MARIGRAKKVMTCASRLLYADRSIQSPLDQNLVDVTPIDLRVLPRRADDREPVSQIRPQGCRVVGPDKREDLFVALLSSGVEGGGEEGLRHTPAPLCQINVGSERADVIERPSIRSERLQNLESKRLAVRLSNRDLPHSTRREVDDVVALGMDAEWRIERRMDPRLNDRIEDSDERFGVGRNSVSNRKIHSLPFFSRLRRPRLLVFGIITEPELAGFGGLEE